MATVMQFDFPCAGRFGITAINAKVFDLSETLSAITHGPLP